MHFFQMKCTEAILLNNTRKLLWLEIAKMLIAVREKNFFASFVIVFGTISLSLLCRVVLMLQAQLDELSEVSRVLST